MLITCSLSPFVCLAPGFLPTRVLLPPTIFLVALPTFLPQLAHNLSTEVSSQTLHYAPDLHHTVSEYRSSLLDKTEDTRAWLSSTKASLGKHLGQGVQLVEDKSGLQLAQAWKNQASRAAGVEQTAPVVVSREASREVTVPLYNQHRATQTIPGTNTVVSHTEPNSRPAEVLSVPVYKQVGGPSSTKERVDGAAARGLDVLEQKGREVLSSAESRAAESKAKAEEKLRQGKSLVREAEQAVERKVERAEEKVKETVQQVKKNATEDQRVKVDEVVVDREGKKVEEVKLESGYKKLV